MNLFIITMSIMIGIAIIRQHIHHLIIPHHYQTGK